MKSAQCKSLTTTCLIWSIMALRCQNATSQEKDFNAYPENVASYLRRIYGPGWATQVVAW